MRLLLACVITMSLLLLPASGAGQSPPQFGKDVTAKQVAWTVLGVESARDIVVQVPGVAYCSRVPKLRSFVTERTRRIVIAVYLVRLNAPEYSCRRVKTLRTRVHFTRPMNGRPLYDSKFSPPRLRPLPETTPAVDAG